MSKTQKNVMLGRLGKSFGQVPDGSVPKIYQLELTTIERNPEQPRVTFDEMSLRELAQSIKKHGLLQPIAVQVKPDDENRYVIVAGERRFRAHELVGLTKINAIIASGDPDELALIENVQREDLRPLEEARAYQRLMEKHSWTHEQLADAVGKNRTTITKVLTLLSLPEDIQQECDAGGVSVSKSMLLEIVASNDDVTQRELWQLARDGKLSIREAREKKTQKTPRAADPTEPYRQMLKAGRTFSQRLGGLPADWVVQDVAHLEQLEAVHQQIGAAIERYKTSRSGR